MRRRQFLVACCSQEGLESSADFGYFRLSVCVDPQIQAVSCRRQLGKPVYRQVIVPCEHRLRIESLVEDKSGVIWIGMGGWGLFQMSSDGVVKSHAGGSRPRIVY